MASDFSNCGELALKGTVLFFSNGMFPNPNRWDRYQLEQAVEGLVCHPSMFFNQLFIR